MRFLALAFALAACGSPAPVQEQKKNPLDPVREPVRHLSQGMMAFVQGKELAEALKPWNVKAPEEAVVAGIRDQLKAAGATGAVCLGLEFEIYFVKDGAGIYRIRATVFVGEKETGLLMFESGQSTAAPPLRLEDLKDAYAGLGAAVKAIAKGGDLPFADPKIAAKELGWPAEREDAVAKMIDEARTNFSAKRAEIDALKYDGVRLQIDDLLLMAVDRDGKVVRTFKSEFVLDNGKPTFKLNRLKAVRD